MYFLNIFSFLIIFLSDFFRYHGKKSKKPSVLQYFTSTVHRNRPVSQWLKFVQWADSDPNLPPPPRTFMSGFYRLKKAWCCFEHVHINNYQLGPSQWGMFIGTNTSFPSQRFYYSIVSCVQIIFQDAKAPLCSARHL